MGKVSYSIETGRSLGGAIIAWYAFMMLAFLFVGIETPVAALITSAASIVTLILLCRAVRFSPVQNDKESGK